ncbi:hypothetical protein FRC12_010946 [Ceratobasidium sp. 428]|nr:hypothetical protein FRC12_010946 [Ceratobasidium sp. 428]
MSLLAEAPGAQGNIPGSGPGATDHRSGLHNNKSESDNEEQDESSWPKKKSWTTSLSADEEDEADTAHIVNGSGEAGEQSKVTKKRKRAADGKRKGKAKAVAADADSETPANSTTGTSLLGPSKPSRKERAAPKERAPPQKRSCAAADAKERQQEDEDEGAREGSADQNEFAAMWEGIVRNLQTQLVKVDAEQQQAACVLRAAWIGSAHL